MRSVAVWALGILVVLTASAVPLWAFKAPVFIGLPEDPTMVLVALGGAGLAWQYFRSRARK
jgi:hypothetical protein